MSAEVAIGADGVFESHMQPQVAPKSAQIVLVAGKMAIPDRLGHHDYVGGCGLLASLVEETEGVTAAVVREGWPDDERVFDSARAVVFYGGGGREHAFVGTPARLRRMQELADEGVGLVMIHQAVRFPPELAERAISWIGGVHISGKANRGHWPTQHRDFPPHPVTRGVQAWETTDGWMNGIRFTASMAGITPIVWSGKEHGGSSAGGAQDIVAWVYERPGGGRAFCFTGLDAHSAWSIPGLRQLLVNGVLWAAGREIPITGAPCGVDDFALRAYLTPRGSTRALALKTIRRALRRIVG